MGACVSGMVPKTIGWWVHVCQEWSPEQVNDSSVSVSVRVSEWAERCQKLQLFIISFMVNNTTDSSVYIYMQAV